MNTQPLHPDLTPHPLSALRADALPFAAIDTDARIAAGRLRGAERENFIRQNAEAIACGAHLRGMTVGEYVERFAPELVEAPVVRRAA